ncbi:MAG: hypothetical protein K2K14_03470 [Ruminococcus sp.]|nr:hypothetical protein [Ruminococcus sp.]MDE6665234.1 hypothetical protein [Ruminococcus sp.]
MAELFIWGLIFAIFCMIINSLKPKEKPPPPPPPKKKYEQSFKEKTVLEILKGKSEDDVIAENEELSADDIKEWKEKFLNDVSDFVEQREQMYNQIGALEVQLKWFHKACEKHIGEDWKEKTGYKGN